MEDPTVVVTHGAPGRAHRKLVGIGLARITTLPQRSSAAGVEGRIKFSESTSTGARPGAHTSLTAIGPVSAANSFGFAPILQWFISQALPMGAFRHQRNKCVQFGFRRLMRSKMPGQFRLKLCWRSAWAASAG
jgi:hypothetical protein